MSELPARLLLDTHTLVWLVQGKLPHRSTSIIDQVSAKGAVLVSTVTAWEIGLLHRKALRGAAAPLFTPDPKTWFYQAMSKPLRETPITAAIAVDSSLLPGQFHSDPGDRLLIATARHLAATLLTRDSRILAYARAGHVDALAC